jgi:hypothetical protein
MNRNTIDGVESVKVVGLAYGQPPHNYGHGRVCTVSGCGTHLSLYNPTCRCWVHNHLV